MVENTFTLNKQHLARIEQIVVDRDEKDALKFLMEIYKKINAKGIVCDPMDLLTRTSVDSTISKLNKK